MAALQRFAHAARKKNNNKKCLTLIDFTCQSIKAWATRMPVPHGHHNHQCWNEKDDSKLRWFPIRLVHSSRQQAHGIIRVSYPPSARITPAGALHHNDGSDVRAMSFPRHLPTGTDQAPRL